MADFKINKTEEDLNALQEKKSAGNMWKLLIVICLLFCIISLIFFLWRQPLFEIKDSIDNEGFGTFGDFVGGLLGTIVAIFSVYFLVRTLRGQIDSNVETRKSNKSVISSNTRLLELNSLQLFDNQFQTLYKQYLNAINNYSYEYENNDLIGRKAFEKKVSVFLDQQFNNGLEYNRRSKAAVSLFEDFYAENRIECSVHFRVLYLLVNLIAESDIDDHNRVVYAKCIRGQLSNSELAMLRYNCMTDNGKKMQQYVNHFNLLKHLPLMTIFEFRKWHDIIADEKYLSAIDSLFISLKKSITNLNDNFDKDSASIEISSRYKIEYCFDSSSNIFNLKITKMKQHKNGGGVKRPFAEKALDCLKEDQLAELFKAFLYESFVAGTFGLYNNEDDCKVGPEKVLKNNDDEYVVFIPVEKTKKLVLAERQVVPGT
jgi:hypothetical protein